MPLAKSIWLTRFSCWWRVYTAHQPRQALTSKVTPTSLARIVPHQDKQKLRKARCYSTQGKASPCELQHPRRTHKITFLPRRLRYNMAPTHDSPVHQVAFCILRLTLIAAGGLCQTAHSAYLPQPSPVAILHVWKKISQSHCHKLPLLPTVRQHRYSPSPTRQTRTLDIDRRERTKSLDVLPRSNYFSLADHLCIPCKFTPSW